MATIRRETLRWLEHHAHIFAVLLCLGVVVAWVLLERHAVEPVAFLYAVPAVTAAWGFGLRVSLPLVAVAFTARVAMGVSNVPLAIGELVALTLVVVLLALAGAPVRRGDLVETR